MVTKSLAPSTQTTLPDRRDGFQQLVLDVLSYEMVPDITANQNVDSCFKTLLSDAVNCLEKSLGRISSGSLSMKDKFYWGILATCCSKITISTENFDWAENYTKDLKLGVVFSTYYTQKLHDDQYTFTSLPDEIRLHPCGDLRRCGVLPCN